MYFQMVEKCIFPINLKNIFEKFSPAIHSYGTSRVAFESSSTLGRNLVQTFHPTETTYNLSRVLCYHSK